MSSPPVPSRPACPPQHVPPLHEATSADHMTMAYRPTPETCLRLPLGREAQLFLVGAAADYRAQVRPGPGQGCWGAGVLGG